jgi:cellulose synthase/poly-beta-1,6-N-acetylglucosamine synthase-like glycosyltransferase
VPPARVSVIVPVRDRRALLARCLDALDAQTYRDVEVVVVDDGSTDGSGDLAASRGVTVVRTTGVGAVAARTAGVAAAAGQVLAFTDSDCEPDPDWLARAVAAIDAGADVVNGRTRPARPTLPLERSMGSGLEGLYPTCNVLYRRDVFERAGGFDLEAGDRLGFRPDRRSKGDGFGEDTMLAWRVARAGGRIQYVPEAGVAHAVFSPDLVDVLSRTARVAAFPGLVKEVPELRDTLLRWRWQLGDRTRLPLYAVVVSVLLGRRPLAAVGTACWVGVRLQELRRFPLPWRRRLAVLPAELAIDVITAGALVVGSVRARSVTL